MIFVDTNYLLRFIRDDIPEQSQKAKELFLSAAKGEVQVTTSTLVIFEIFWVTQKFYGEDKKEVAFILKRILSMDFLLILEKNILEEALEIFSKTTLELEDCYNISYSQSKKLKEFKTFDKKLSNYINKL